MKRLIAILLVLVFTLSMIACGNGSQDGNTNSSPENNTAGDDSVPSDGGTENNQAADYDFSDVKIGIIGFSESGENLNAITAYMDYISAGIGFSYEYVAGSSYDEQTNITTAQNLIASGCKGIIMCMDSGMQAILQECESAGVYLAGFLCDMDTSLDTIKDNPYYLGNVCDGTYSNAEIGTKAAELLIADGAKHAGIITFPLIYYPLKAEAIDAFTEVLENYNQDADEPIELYETVELSFSALEDTYFEQHPEIDAILGLASGFIYPTMASVGRTDVKLYSTGYKEEDADAFLAGSIRMMTLSNTEAIVYPIAMILNEVSGMTYEDKPAAAERVDTSTMYVTNEEEFRAMVDKAFYCTNDTSLAFISVDGLKDLLRVYNSDATYKELTDLLMNMSIEDVMAK